jgi:Carboxypeptidase regulatory-like domain
MIAGKILRAVFVCLLVCFFSRLSFSQANGSFSGTVVDKTGSVISNATVKITSQQTGLSRDVKTDDTGRYLVPLLPVSVYTIRAEAQGFQATEQRDLRLQVNEQREINFTLAPASVSERVEVSAQEVAVQTTNPTLGQVITQQQVAQLPLNGRNFVQLATLTPGTTTETAHSFFNEGTDSEASARGSYSLSVGGSRPQSTDWLLDNVDNNELTAGAIGIVPSIDAIQEFKVLTYNYSAEYGTRAGPTVLVTTKSGSNQLHGSAFEFFRNTKLDARSFFAATREQFNLNQYGGSLGGPIRKDKTFFFVDYQGKNQRRGVPFTGLVPTVAMQQGNFNDDQFGNPRTTPLTNPYSGAPFQCAPDGITPLTPDSTTGVQPSGTPCSVIPPELRDPAGLQLVRLYPTSNTSNPAAGFNFTNVPVRKLDEKSFDVRLDHNFSTKDSLFARFSYDQAVSFVPGGSPSFAEQSAFGSTQNIDNHARNAVISETHIFSEHNINQFTFGYNRIFNFIHSFASGTCEAAKLGIANANLDPACGGAGLPQSTKVCVSCGLTSISLNQGYWAIGDRGFAPFQGGTNVFSIADSFDMIRGKHDIKVGFGFRAHQMNVLTNAFQDGSFSVLNQTGDAMADLTMGLYSNGFHDQTFLGATTGRRWKMYRPYIQDDWRVTPNLTLNLGVAWSIVPPVTEAHNRQANFNFLSNCSPHPDCNQLIPGVNSDGRVGIKFDKTAVEPRVGFAWKVLGRQETVLRGGYAIFHDSSWNQGAQGLWESPPFFFESGQFNFIPGICGTPKFPSNPYSNPAFNPCAISAGFPLVTTPQPVSNFAGTVLSQDLDFKQGMVQQYNFNLEQGFPGGVVLTLGYAGSRSTHILLQGLNQNVGSPSACDPSSPTFDPNYKLGCAPGGGAVVPPYNIFYVSNIGDRGSGRYDSLQVKAETKNIRHGLYALVGYTWSHAFDNGLPDGLGSNVGATYWPLPGTTHLDWALSQLNVGHQFTASVIYDLPIGRGKRVGGNWNGALNAALGNWQVTVIEKATSGFPVFVFNSNNESGVNFEYNFLPVNRPDQICDPVSTHKSITQWFNVNCFVPAAVGQLGTANRTPVSGPRFVNTDFSLIKRFPITERAGLDLRAEFFNLFNHPQFGEPGNDMSQAVGGQVSSQFGVINTTVNNPRLIQFALKLTF